MGKQQTENAEGKPLSSNIINCHAHIFTSDYVPPYLAKTFIPFYKLLPINLLIKLVRWWFNSEKSPYKWPYQRWYKLLQQGLYQVKISTQRYKILAIIKFIVGIIILLSAFHELYSHYFRAWMIEQGLKTNHTDEFIEWLKRAGLMIITSSWFLKGLLLLLLLVFFPSGRNFLFFILRKFSSFMKMLPGKQTLAMMKRYMNIVRFARYKNQSNIFARLRHQYPEGSAMVVLPMDMEFMGAGNPPKSFGQQMDELAKIKKNYPDTIYPFVFIDPRREKVNDVPFFDYEIDEENNVVLKPCFIKTYIEAYKFSGFKIYPALGYFPFDEKLLPLWKYAADNSIPILTHCIRGTIFYRGKKEKDWDVHPVFEQYEGSQTDMPPNEKYFQPLRLAQMKPLEVQEIFTHPMNYACLLKRDWLTKLVANAKEDNIRKIFGYDPVSATIQRGLEHLKLCFAHFGGDDEWSRFLERDRDNWGQQLSRFPSRGIAFIPQDGSSKRGRAEQLWKYADWYSLICSLMIQHENVYADISYILHSDKEILPLLKQTLRNDSLKEKVLFGTDFYVVRNHKADKQMLADMMGGLSEVEFDQIARVNPRKFLNI